MSSQISVNDDHPRTMNFGMVAMMLCCLAQMAGFFFFQPGASGYGLLLFLLLMACPLMHLFMHRAHRGD